LNQVRQNRDNTAVQVSLNRLREVAASGQGNLLALSIEAVRIRATVGEISDAIEQAWGRYNAPIRSIAGVYGSEYAEDSDFADVREEINQFAVDEGRRPRIIVAKMGQDGHDRGAKVISTAFADLGFDVDIGPLFQTPEEVVRQAIENDVHVIGISSQAAGHKTLVQQLMQVLLAEKVDDMVVVVGGVIPPQDYEYLYQQGVACIFGPGTKIPQAAREVLSAVRERTKVAA